MTTVLVASGTLGAAVPIAATLKASLLANVERELAASLKLLADLQVDLPALQADLEATANIGVQLQANLSVDPTASIAASLAYSADAQLALDAGLSGPSFSAEIAASLTANVQAVADLSAKVSAKAGAITELTARIGALRAALALAHSVEDLLLAGGVRVYLYTGPLSALSAELGAFLDAGGGDGIAASATVYVPVLITDSSASFVAMKGVLNLGP